MPPPLLESRELKKYFPVTEGFLRREVAQVKAVDGINITINKGEVVALVGESGCGKSTAGRAMIRLIEPTSGELYFEGQDLLKIPNNKIKPFRKDLQIVFQDPYASLNPRKTVGESLTEPLIFHSLAKNRDDAHEKAESILKRVGIHEDALSKYPHQFSGGQQQRICIGRAIGLEPKLLVCDEALSALDVSVQAQILNLLIDIQRISGLSYLFISHDLSIVRHLADRVFVLYLGKVMETAPTKKLFSSPKHPYTQALLSAIPRSHPKQEKQRILLYGEVPSPRSPPTGCPFRTRCPYAQPICAETPPVKTDGEQEYHCIL